MVDPSSWRTLHDHLLKIKKIWEKLEAIGRKVEEKDTLVIMLKNLPHAYQHFIETLNITAMDVDLKFGELCNNLLQYDICKKQFGSNSEIESSKQIFVANVKGKSKWAK